jgi:hypothetical protein
MKDVLESMRKEALMIRRHLTAGTAVCGIHTESSTRQV